MGIEWVIAAAVVGLLFGSVLGLIAGSGLGKPKAAEFTRPIAQEDAAIYIARGTVDITDPNVIWVGDVSTRPVRASGGKKP